MLSYETTLTLTKSIDRQNFLHYKNFSETNQSSNERYRKLSKLDVDNFTFYVSV